MAIAQPGVAKLRISVGSSNFRGNQKLRDVDNGVNKTGRIQSSLDAGIDAGEDDCFHILALSWVVRLFPLYYGNNNRVEQ